MCASHTLQIMDSEGYLATEGRPQVFTLLAVDLLIILYSAWNVLPAFALLQVRYCLGGGGMLPFFAL